MRHRVKRKKLGLKVDHRQALTKNLARSMFLSGKVETTQARARVLVRLVERMISRAKKGDVSAKRFIYRYFQDQNLANMIVDQIASVFKDRNGGFTRTVKAKRRKGDNAVLVRIEFVEKVDIDFKKPEDEKKKKVKKAGKETREKKTKKEAKK